MRRFFLVLVALALMPPASAWGPQAHKDFCREAVSAVWGERGLKCLEDRVAYCLELKQNKGESTGQQCLDAYASQVEIDPSTAPEVLFNDAERHYNYDNCPLQWIRQTNDWICSGKGNPAGEEAAKWFDISSRSEDYCGQVRSFCTGSFYYTSSQYPLLRVKYLQGCVGGELDTLIDEKIISGVSNWIVKDQCTFMYLRPMAGVSRLTTQHITFVVTEADYDALQTNLTLQAEYVRNPALTPQSTTTTTESTTTTASTSTTSTESTTSTTATTIPATTTTEPTSTSTAATSSTVSVPTSTISTTTTTESKPPATAEEPALNESLAEIDKIISELQTSINKTKAEKKPADNTNMLILGGLGALLLLSLVLLVYLYSMMRRPTMHTSRKVVLPPSMRRRMRKAK